MRTNNKFIRAGLKALLMALFYAASALTAQATTWHVAPSTTADGDRPGGNGTDINPWGLQTALAGGGGSVQLGDIILMHQDPTNPTTAGYWGYKASNMLKPTLLLWWAQLRRLS